MIDPNAIVDPSNPARTTLFPVKDSGDGCDQVLTYSEKYDLFIWVIPTWSTPIKVSGFDASGPNRERIAWATSAALQADFLHAWRWIEVDSALLGVGNDWFDYPDVTVSENNVYMSVDRAHAALDPCNQIVERLRKQ